jgi:hypothetical protein
MEPPKMKFKNYQKSTVRFTSKFGGHCMTFATGQTREVAPHMEELALANGLVPQEDFIEAKENREAEDVASDEKEAKLAKRRQADAVKRKAATLKKASEQAEKDLIKQDYDIAKAK